MRAGTRSFMTCRSSRGHTYRWWTEWSWVVGRASLSMGASAWPQKSEPLQHALLCVLDASLVGCWISQATFPNPVLQTCNSRLHDCRAAPSKLRTAMSRTQMLWFAPSSCNPATAVNRVLLLSRAVDQAAPCEQVAVCNAGVWHRALHRCRGRPLSLSHPRRDRDLPGPHWRTTYRW